MVQISTIHQRFRNYSCNFLISLVKSLILVLERYFMNITEEKSERNRFERKLDEYNHTMEFIRTLVPIAVLIIQVVILIKLF